MPAIENVTKGKSKSIGLNYFKQNPDPKKKVSKKKDVPHTPEASSLAPSGTAHHLFSHEYRFIIYFTSV
jgi:hypothetical protein